MGERELFTHTNLLLAIAYLGLDRDEDAIRLMKSVEHIIGFQNFEDKSKLIMYGKDNPNICTY